MPPCLSDPHEGPVTREKSIESKEIGWEKYQHSTIETMLCGAYF